MGGTNQTRRRERAFLAHVVVTAVGRRAAQAAFGLVVGKSNTTATHVIPSKQVICSPCVMMGCDVVCVGDVTTDVLIGPIPRRYLLFVSIASVRVATVHLRRLRHDMFPSLKFQISF